MKLQLLKWYQKHKRDLPWRKTTLPYNIWISETMLQQTTSTAVIPFYHRFLKRFPNIKALATAPENHVLEQWTGLGYYSRARNLHKAAKIIYKNKSFPKNYEELIQLPGFGPYTSRAVASFAFHEPVGVLDGNVIRFLTRYYNQKIQWWKTHEKNLLQEQADHWAKENSPVMNQALMEIGSTICTPKNPSCLICPVNSQCLAFSHQTQNELPLKKQKPEKIILKWDGELFIQKKNHLKYIALIKNNYAPFLKGQWILPGQIKKMKTKPKNFHFKHNITKYDIYGTAVKSKNPPPTSVQWVPEHQIRQWSQSSLIQKALTHIVLLLPFVLLNIQCQNKNLKKDSLPPPSQTLHKYIGSPLTFMGDNTQPSYAPNGTSVIYISALQTSHKHPQVYLLERNDVTTTAPAIKRLTYQLGSNHSPSLLKKKNQFAYSSTTDEDKENPLFLQKKPTPIIQLAPFSAYRLDNYELYKSTFVDTKINRLTQRPGWDAQAQYIDDHWIIFSQKNPSGVQIVKYNIQTKQKTILTDSKLINIEPRYSSFAKKILWLEWNPNDLTTNRLLSSEVHIIKTTQLNSIKVLATHRKLILSPDWHPTQDWVVYSYINEQLGYDVEILDISKNCIISLISQPGDDLWPHFSPNGERILYANNDTGLFQIFEYTLASDLKCSPIQ